MNRFSAGALPFCAMIFKALSIISTRYLVKTFSGRSVKPRSKWVLNTTQTSLTFTGAAGGLSPPAAAAEKAAANKIAPKQAVFIA